MFRFHKRYFLGAVSLFVLELCIALFVQDRIIRPYIGDFLVVILIYCFLRSFLNITPVRTAIGVLIFAYIVEISQYFNLIEILGLKGNRPARMILGSAFSWADMVAYTLGIISVLWMESKKRTSGSALN